MLVVMLQIRITLSHLLPIIQHFHRQQSELLTAPMVCTYLYLLWIDNSQFPASPPVDVCSIDHLPSLVPRSSSSEYSEGFHRHLLGFGQSSVWQRALDIFNEKTAQLQK